MMIAADERDEVHLPLRHLRCADEHADAMMLRWPFYDVCRLPMRQPLMPLIRYADFDYCAAKIFYDYAPAAMPRR
jgi:hypothetical protein